MGSEEFCPDKVYRRDVLFLCLIYPCCGRGPHYAQSRCRSAGRMKLLRGSQVANPCASSFVCIFCEIIRQTI